MRVYVDSNELINQMQEFCKSLPGIEEATLGKEAAEAFEEVLD